MTAATAAADQRRDQAAADELDRQWEERTRPTQEAPRSRSIYLRADLAAACPGQHLAYLKCLKESKSWVPFSSINACHDEYKAFAICKQRAKASKQPPRSADAEPEQSTAAKLWADLQREPAYIAAKMSVQDALQKLGFGSSSESEAGSSSSSSAGSSSSEGSSGGGSSTRS